MTAGAAHRRALRTLASDYFAEVGAIDYPELTRRQPPPFASIGFGAGGIVYALLHAGRRRRDQARLIEARRWLDGAWRRRRARRAFLDGWISPSYIDNSVSDGPAGLDYLGALLADALGDRRARERHLVRFLTHAGLQPRSPELLHGRAGFLIAALVLERELGDDRAREIADQLAASLLDLRWGLPTTAFAHGDAGVLHALFEWAHVRDRTLPDAVPALLERLARPRPAPPRMRSSWCNGAAGDLLLWTKAYRHYGTVRYLRRAERHACACRPIGDEHASLCCGLGGAAYALLALERVAPASGAGEQALATAARAAATMASSHPNAVLRGYPGLVCLAIDLLDGGGGFPLVEVPW